MANTLKLYRNGDVGFIDLLDDGQHLNTECDGNSDLRDLVRAKSPAL